MRLPDLRQALAARDVHLSLRLVVDAPRGVLSDALRAALTAHKPQLLVALARQAQWEALEPKGDLSEPADAGPDRYALAEREAIQAEPPLTPAEDGPPAAPPAGQETVADWPTSWRQVWGLTANALEDALSVAGESKDDAGLAAQAAVSHCRGEGMKPGEALAAIWDLLGLPGEPPILGLESEWPSPRPEPLSDAEALRQIEDDPWPEVSHATSVAEGRCWNSSVVDGHSSRRAPKGYWPSPHDWRPGHCRLV